MRTDTRWVVGGVTGGCFLLGSVGSDPDASHSNSSNLSSSEAAVAGLCGAGSFHVIFLKLKERKKERKQRKKLRARGKASRKQLRLNNLKIIKLS